MGARRCRARGVARRRPHNASGDLVFCGAVNSELSRKARMTLHARLSEIEAARSPFTDMPSSAAVRWVQPCLVRDDRVSRVQRPVPSSRLQGPSTRRSDDCAAAHGRVAHRPGGRATWDGTRLRPIPPFCFCRPPASGHSYDLPPGAAGAGVRPLRHRGCHHPGPAHPRPLRSEGAGGGPVCSGLAAGILGETAFRQTTSETPRSRRPPSSGQRVGSGP